MNFCRSMHMTGWLSDWAIVILISMCGRPVINRVNTKRRVARPFTNTSGLADGRESNRQLTKVIAYRRVVSFLGENRSTPFWLYPSTFARCGCLQQAFLFVVLSNRHSVVLCFYSYFLWMRQEEFASTNDLAREKDQEAQTLGPLKPVQWAHSTHYLLKQIVFNRIEGTRQITIFGTTWLDDRHESRRVVHAEHKLIDCVQSKFIYRDMSEGRLEQVKWMHSLGFSRGERYACRWNGRTTTSTDTTKFEQMILWQAKGVSLTSHGPPLCLPRSTSISTSTTPGSTRLMPCATTHGKKCFCVDSMIRLLCNVQP